MRFAGNFRDACLVVAEQCYGPRGVWAHHAFDYINASFFGGRLPHPHIMWGLTPHGGCVAWASCSKERSRPPVITLHPALLDSPSRSPWGLPRHWIGASLVFDTLLHECIHVHIERQLGGHDGSTSHNCARWVRQANRLARLLHFEDVVFGGSKLIRVPIKGAVRGPRGRLPTRVVRVSTGTVPFRVCAGFPMTLRRFQGTADAHYAANVLPIGVPSLLE